MTIDLDLLESAAAMSPAERQSHQSPAGDADTAALAELETTGVVAQEQRRTVEISKLFWWLCGATLAAGVGLYFVNSDLWVLVVPAISILLLGWAWPYLTARLIQAQVEVDKLHVTEGQPVTLRIVLLNKMLFLALGLRVQGLTKSSELRLSRDLLDHDPDKQIEFKAVIKDAPRGTLPAEKVALFTDFPFKLVKACIPLKMVGKTLVQPKPADIGALRFERREFDRYGVAKQYVGVDLGPSPEDDLVEPGQITDEYTTKIGAEREQGVYTLSAFKRTTGQPTVLLVLDAEHTRYGNDARREQAIRRAAAVLHAAHRQKDVLVDMVIGRQFFFGSLRELLDELAMLDHHNSPASHPEVYSEPRLTKKSPYDVRVAIGPTTSIRAWRSQTDELNDIFLDDTMTGRGRA